MASSQIEMSVDKLTPISNPVMSVVGRWLNLINATQASDPPLGFKLQGLTDGRSVELAATCSVGLASAPTGWCPWESTVVSRPLVFSFDPRRHGLCRSQKYTSMFVLSVNRR